MHSSVRRLVIVVAVLAAVIGMATPAQARTRLTARRPIAHSQYRTVAGTLSAASTTLTGADCGGLSLAKSTGGTWTCTWDDEFNGTTLDATKWAVQTTAASGFATKPACFVNSPNNVSVANGVLSLTARKEAKAFACKSPTGSFTTQYTSGEVMSYGKFAQAYGRFEVRAKFPAATVAGLQSALWLFPSDYAKYGAWPASGEIDIAEEYSRYADRAIPFVHYISPTLDTNVTNNYCTIASVNAFHSYTVEWTASTITVSYDGKTCITDYAPTLAPGPFSQPFVVALTQALGVGGNAFTSSTPLPATTQVDYVRVWS